MRRLLAPGNELCHPVSPSSRGFPAPNIFLITKLMLNAPDRGIRQALENILSVRAGLQRRIPPVFVAMSKGSFDGTRLAASAVFFPYPPRTPLPVLINRLLAGPRLPFQWSLAGLFLFFRDVSANFQFLELLKSFAAMVALVRNKFFNPGYVDLGFLFRMQPLLRDRPKSATANPASASVSCMVVVSPRSSRLQGDGHHRARIQIDRNVRPCEPSAYCRPSSSKTRAS